MTKTTAKPVVLTDSAVYSKHVDATHKAATAVTAMIQVALASALYFAAKDGNATPANQLLVGMNKGIRRSAMADWLMTYGPFVAQTDKEKAKENPIAFSREKLEKLMGDAKPSAEAATQYAQSLLETKPWDAHKPEPIVPESFDFKAALAALIKRAGDMKEKGAKIEGEDLLARANAIVLAPADTIASV